MSISNAISSCNRENSVPPGVSDRGLLRGSLGLAGVSLIGFGLLYSLTGVGLGQALFPEQANGSLVGRDGRVLGSTLVAQPFSDSRYFLSRPSAANFDPMALAGSNQSRTNPDLSARIDEARKAIAQHAGIAPAAVPGDLLTQSGGGIDPHVSPSAAAIQVDRVAQARGLPSAVVAELVARHTEGRQLGWLGQPRVNVLELNLALDAASAAGPAGKTTR